MTQFKRRSPLLRLRQYNPSRPPVVAPVAEGRLIRVVGMTIEAVGLQASLGQRCEIHLDNGKRLEAEVVGFAEEKVFLMPVQNIEGLKQGARVVPLNEQMGLRAGQELLGRIINGLGEPLDGLPKWTGEDHVRLSPNLINPLRRDPISEPLDVGVRAINALLTIGRGQRVGLFAGSGVGKSVLLGMMTRFTEAEIIVVGLIGERGREVKEFIDHNLGPEGLARSVVVASPADDPPLMRLRASQLATRIAEYYRDQGKNVLLLMDSLTRYAQAQREIGLATGEPPTTKGYPPSVFSKIPQLVERAGNGDKGGGSITAIYTVLTEGDDLQDPIADATRAILDGHIVLSRRLAEEGQYPAVDVEASISRVMPAVVESKQLQQAQKFKQLLAKYHQSKDLISIGAYNQGADPQTDQAIALQSPMREFLCQAMHEPAQYGACVDALDQLLGATAQAPPSPKTAKQSPLRAGR